MLLAKQVTATWQCHPLQVGLAIQAAKQRLEVARAELQPRRRFAFAGRSRAPDQAAGAPAAAAGPVATAEDPAAAATLTLRDPEGAARAGMAACAAARSAGASGDAAHVAADRAEASRRPAKQAGEAVLDNAQARRCDDAAAAPEDGVLSTDWCGPSCCVRTASAGRHEQAQALLGSMSVLQ